jgi:uncharacterized FlaG/YvyC family protein
MHLMDFAVKLLKFPLHQQMKGKIVDVLEKDTNWRLVIQF